MLATNTNLLAQEVFQEKSGKVHDLYNRLLDELKRLGPVNVTKKAISISLSSNDEKEFAWIIIRNRSIKLVFRTHHRIASERITYIHRVGAKYYDHTILVESKLDIDPQLMKWLGEAYEEVTSR